MKLKHIIGGVIIALGMLLQIGAVGRLDYLDECSVRYGSEEIRAMVVKTVSGLAVVGVGIFLCRDIEVSDEEKENRAD